MMAAWTCPVSEDFNARSCAYSTHPGARSTSEVAYLVLGRVDVEAVRQVRRAVDALAGRGLVRTWTGPNPGRRGRVRWVELVPFWSAVVDVDDLPEVWQAS